MFSKITEGVQSKLVDLLLSPAAFFWLAGLLAFCDAHRPMVAAFFAHPPDVKEPLILAASLAALALVVFTAAAYEPFNYWMLDRLAGYWGFFDLLGEPLRERLRGRRRALSERYQAVYARGTSASVAELSELEMKLRALPTEKNMAATRFGCAMIAADMRIAAMYGLSANICWPALRLVLGDGARQPVADAQAAVEASGRLIFWTLATVVWMPLWPSWQDRALALAVFAFVLVFAYAQLVARGREYADAYENAFGIGRFSLYKALRLPLPETYALEREAGKNLTSFILRGVTVVPIVYDAKA